MKLEQDSRLVKGSRLTKYSAVEDGHYSYAAHCHTASLGLVVPSAGSVSHGDSTQLARMQDANTFVCSFARAMLRKRAIRGG